MGSCWPAGVTLLPNKRSMVPVHGGGSSDIQWLEWRTAEDSELVGWLWWALLGGCWVLLGQVRLKLCQGYRLQRTHQPHFYPLNMLVARDDSQSVVVAIGDVCCLGQWSEVTTAERTCPAD